MLNRPLPVYEALDLSQAGHGWNAPFAGNHYSANGVGEAYACFQLLLAPLLKCLAPPQDFVEHAPEKTITGAGGIHRLYWKSRYKPGEIA